MTSFGQIDMTPPPMRFDEYLNSLEEPDASVIQAMFSAVDLSARHMYQLPTGDHPELIVTFRDNINGGAMAGRIEVTEALVRHCARLTVSEEFAEHIAVESSLIPVKELVWIFVIKHEYSHIYRRHNDSATTVGDSTRVSRALEFDADLNATASAYRYLQNRYRGELDDLKIRYIVLYCIVSFLCDHPTSASSTHGSTAERAWLINMKLTQLNPDPNVAPDPNQMTAEQKQRLPPLVSMLIDILQLYERTHPDVAKVSTELPAVLDCSSDRIRVTQTWDQIRGTVGAISGTLT